MDADNLSSAQLYTSQFDSLLEIIKGWPPRDRPRVYPYHSVLPYDIESEDTVQNDLELIVENLFIAVKSGDLLGTYGHSRGSQLLFWTKRLQKWIGLKYDISVEKRIILLRFYFQLCIIPGVDGIPVLEFVWMFHKLCKDSRLSNLTQYGLVLDWPQLVKNLRDQYYPFLIPDGVKLSTGSHPESLLRLADAARAFAQWSETGRVLEEILPYFTIRKYKLSHNAILLLRYLVPKVPTHKGAILNPTPTVLLRTYFYLWGIQPRSSMYDGYCLALVETLVSDCLKAESITFSKTGILTDSQLAVIFTAALRLLEIPVSYAGSPYIDSQQTASLETDDFYEGVPVVLARLVVNSMGRESSEEGGLLTWLDMLVNSIETFLHPSNSGSWTYQLASFNYHLAEFFVNRWQAQQQNEEALSLFLTPSEEPIVPVHKSLTKDTKRKFVEILINITLLGLHSKIKSSVFLASETLAILSHLEPDIVFPLLLKEAYLSLQGLVSTHRTPAVLRALTVVPRSMARVDRYAFHMTSLIVLALPGIDVNDLEKSKLSLDFIKGVALNIPIKDVSGGIGEATVQEHITNDVHFLSVEGCNLAVAEQGESATERSSLLKMPDIDEETLKLLKRSSTCFFDKILQDFLNRLFLLLEDMPAQSESNGAGLITIHSYNFDNGHHTHRNSASNPEESIVAHILSAFNAILISTDEPNFKTILKHFTDFITSNVIHNSVHVVSLLCGMFTVTNARLTVPRLLPALIEAVKQEVLENGAGRKVMVSSDSIISDRAFNWYYKSLCACLECAGAELLPFQESLSNLTMFLRDRVLFCPTELLNCLFTALTSIYPIEYGMYQKPDPNDFAWGKRMNPNDLSVSWHLPNEDEISFAIDLYKCHAQLSLDRLNDVMACDSLSELNYPTFTTSISDEVSRNIEFFTSCLKGMKLLFDIPGCSFDYSAACGEIQSPFKISQDEVAYQSYYYLNCRDGYYFADSQKDPRKKQIYEEIHVLRSRIGLCLHHLHLYVTKYFEDSVACFESLLSSTGEYFRGPGLSSDSHSVTRILRWYFQEIEVYFSSAIRKDVPRPALVLRAWVQQVERTSYNYHKRKLSIIDQLLLHDTAKCMVSGSLFIAGKATHAATLAFKALKNSKELLYPWIIDALSKVVDNKETMLVESGMFSLLWSLQHLVAHIRNSPRSSLPLLRVVTQVMRLFDKTGLHQIAVRIYSSAYSSFFLPLNELEIPESLTSNLISGNIEHLLSRIEIRLKEYHSKRSLSIACCDELMVYLMNETTEFHWKITYFHLGLLLNISKSVQVHVPAEVLTVFARSAISAVPSIRSIGLKGLCDLLSKKFRLAYIDYSYYQMYLDVFDERYKLSDAFFLANSAERIFGEEQHNLENPKFYTPVYSVGWLVWPKQVVCQWADKAPIPQFTDKDKISLERVGNMIDKEWVQTLFKYLADEKQRREDDYYNARVALQMTMLTQMIEFGWANLKIDDFLNEIRGLYNGDDHNTHRGTAELCTALLFSLPLCPESSAKKKLDLILDLFDKALKDMDHENISYWTGFVGSLFQGVQYNRVYPLIEKLLAVDFGVLDDSSSLTVFNITSRIKIIRKAMRGMDVRAINHMENFINQMWQMIDVEYQGIREEVAKAIYSMYTYRFHSGIGSVEKLLTFNKSDDLGGPLYQIPEDLSLNLNKAHAQLKVYKEIHDAKVVVGRNGQGDRYVNAAKTLALCYSSFFKTAPGICLVSEFKTIIPTLLDFLIVRGDDELISLAAKNFVFIGNLPYRKEQIGSVLSIIVSHLRSVGWRQKLTLLGLTQIFFFRQYFMMKHEDRKNLLTVVVELLGDEQVEVRELAAETLCGFIRCSSRTEKEAYVEELGALFAAILEETKTSSKKSVSKHMPDRRTNASVPVRKDNARNRIIRQKAVLGLGAVIGAFPYVSPLPLWFPKILNTLARVASETGIAGKSARQAISDFKKLRQDTWHIDSKTFTSDELKDLEGVLSSNYFA